MLQLGTSRTHSRDILSSPRFTLALFCLPIIVIVVAGQSDIGVGWRTALWTAALGTMGTACLVNAMRCGRIHCYATGPFFLLMAIVTLLYGLDILPLGKNGWNLISLTILFGTIVFCCLPELIWGKYRKDCAAEGERR